MLNVAAVDLISNGIKNRNFGDNTSCFYKAVMISIFMKSAKAYHYANN